MSPKLFRLLILTELFLLIGAIAASILLEDRLPVALVTYLDSQIDAPSVFETPAGFAAAIAILSTAFASYIGLAFFRNWGRTLWVITTIAGYLLVLFDPTPIIEHAFSSALLSITTTMSGFLIAVAYLHEPIAERFRKEPLPDWTPQ